MKLIFIFAFLMTFYCANSVRNKRGLDETLIPDEHASVADFVDYIPKLQLPSLPDLPTLPEIPNPVSEDDIRNLKPDNKNTVVNGASVSSSSSIETVNGKPVKKESSGHIVVNRNGNVTETKFGHK